MFEWIDMKLGKFLLLIMIMIMVGGQVDQDGNDVGPAPLQNSKVQEENLRGCDDYFRNKFGPFRTICNGQSSGY
jgi:hypothetical protein